MPRNNPGVSMTTPRQETARPSDQQASRGIDWQKIPQKVLDFTKQRIPSKRLLISLDFGTTFSAVSYVALKEGEEHAGYLPLDRIGSIKNFPEDWNEDSHDSMKNEVPTEIMYPTDPKFREQEGLKYDPPQQRDDDDDVDADGDIEIGGPLNDPRLHGLPAAQNGIRADHAEARHDQILAMYEQSNSFRWGYGVHELWSLPSIHLDKTNQAMARFKLLLDESPTTENIRNELKTTLDTLKLKRIITSSIHVIADFLTCLLRHTRSELDAQGFDDTYNTEMVLCVPAIWTQKACRDMQTALALAMANAKFPGVDLRNNCIENLFIVSEPEAAAAFSLANDWQIAPGDAFVLLDAGGGTVDANTYEVSATMPLRLTREVVAPGGGLFGSSFVNNGFRTLLRELLRDEVYLERRTETIDGIIEKLIINEFEYRIKRSFDYTTAKGLKRFSITDLRDNRLKGFAMGNLHVTVEKITEIFMPCLSGIAQIMTDQINTAKRDGCHVKKVVLIGGFAGSPSLKKYIQRRLDQHQAETGSQITLVCPENATNAVASGALLRAFNKENGPKRQARSSYGILRTEPFRDWEEHKHRKIKPTYDAHDGMPYITNTIDWVLKLGEEVPSVWCCEPLTFSHTFDCSPSRRLICREVLYVSDHATQSHYKRNHSLNKGAEEVGDIEVDFTFLRDEGLLAVVEPDKDKRGKNIGVRHYKVEYKMYICVVDRDLKCYAYYNGEQMKACRINIASAFRPGVK